MLFNALERITLLDVLPREGNFQTLKMLRVFREDLSFDEQENKDLKMQAQPDLNTGMISYKWDSAGDKPKEIRVGEKMRDVICDTLKDMDRRGKLTEQHMGLYERFIEHPEEDNPTIQTARPYPSRPENNGG